MPPRIRSEDEVYNSLAGIYDPQTQLVGKQMGEADVAAASDLSALDQAKINAFRTIENRSNARGVLFSGVSPSEELTYTGEKFLPAVARVKQSQTSAKDALTATLNRLSAQRRQEAQGGVQSDTKLYNDWVKEQNTLAYRNAQLDLGYKRLAVSQSRASTAAGRPVKVSEGDVVGEIRAGLEKVKGRDNHVAPQALKAAYNLYAGAGYNPQNFWKYFQGYWNPKQGNYKQQFNSA